MAACQHLLLAVLHPPAWAVFLNPLQATPRGRKMALAAVGVAFVWPSGKGTYSDQGAGADLSNVALVGEAGLNPLDT